MRYEDIKFTLVRHANDFVYAFDLPGSRYHGYTRDYSTFHVYDENTQAYTSYTTKGAFTAWLSNFGQGNNQTQYKVPPVIKDTISNIKYTGLPKTNVNGFNATPLIILGAVGVIAWLYLQN
jgi:hypothetical protein